MAEFKEVMQGKSPREVRYEFRKGNYFKTAVSGIGKGYIQMNLLVVHKDVAEDLENYCRLNYGPMAKIVNSKPGQFDLPGLATDCDIRTDLSAYNVFVNGEHTETVPDLLKFGDQLNDFCFFYFGCSFSFDDALLSGGVPLRHLEQGKTNISMYKSNIQCHPCGHFHGNQVVSMRPIPRDLVEKCFQITHPMSNVHGAPVHIGDPSVIGINLQAADYGCDVNFKDGDVPVFWPCGVTGIETLKASKQPLAFTHMPGCMLITDTLLHKHDATPPPEDLPRVVWLADSPPLASVTSQATVDKIKKLEDEAIEDIGQRQIGNLLVPNDLLKSALSLSHANSVAITTGFPVLLEGDNLYETDGPPGAIAVAAVLQALGKNAVLVLDDIAGLVELTKKMIASLIEKGVLSQPITIECYPLKGQNASTENATAFLTQEDGKTPRFDHLLAIERAGRARDGHYYSSKRVDKGSRIENIDLLFEIAQGMPGVFTTGIGDGGNELGMGKVMDRTAIHVPNGEFIACAVATDYLICAGVSNWGGYALAIAVALLRMCPIHDRYRRRAVGLPPSQEEILGLIAATPTVDKEEKVLQTLVDLKFLDASQEVKMAVDWLPFHDVHANKIKQISDLLF